MSASTKVAGTTMLLWYAGAAWLLYKIISKKSDKPPRANTGGTRTMGPG